MNICPCCKRAMPRTKATKLDKRLSEDIAKAEHAIANLEFNAANSPIDLSSDVLAPHILLPRIVDRKQMRIGTYIEQDIASPRNNFLAAIESELTRMRSALTDHRLLWSIYRRADKKAPYYEIATEAEVAA